MTIVMLAAGTSSRMGEKNKMILPYKNTTMIAHCCMQALLFLDSLKNEALSNRELIVVTGYMKEEAEQALKPCFEYSEKRNIKLTLIHNTNYKEGQYSSTLCGVSKVKEGEPFFISLADMPLVNQYNYKALLPLLKDYDVVRPFVLSKDKSKKPGHPVFLSYKMKKAIEINPNIGSVNRLLNSNDNSNGNSNAFKINEPSFTEDSWAFDVDTPQVYESLQESIESIESTESETYESLSM